MHKLFLLVKKLEIPGKRCAEQCYVLLSIQRIDDRIGFYCRKTLTHINYSKIVKKANRRMFYMSKSRGSREKGR